MTFGEPERQPSERRTDGPDGPDGNDVERIRGDAAALALLERGTIEVLGLLPRASNFTFLARVRADRDQMLAVYKPRSGEAPLWDFEGGTLAAREVAAYVVADALGWPWVPPTVLREGPQGTGSVQRFVAFDPDQHYLTMQHDRADEFRKIALFDVVANNADRKSGHCLLAEDGRIFVVDHGVCFHVDP
ncbi:MAG TPA: phosphatidylinositol kinase, partial [Actinomycetota bacterium]